MNAPSDNATNSTNNNPDVVNDVVNKVTAAGVAPTISTKNITTSEKSTMLERRQGHDRRRWTCNHDFPYVDSHGYLVEQNRRQTTDRRCSVQKRQRGD